MICKARKRRLRKPKPHADAGLQYVADNWSQLRLLVARLGRKQRPDLIDDLVSEIVIDRVPALVHRWDPNHPSGMPLKLWVDQGVRKYVSKWFKARGVREGMHEGLPDELEAFTNQSGDDDEDDGGIEEVLSLLSPLDRNLLEARYVDGMTNDEIAAGIGLSSKSTSSQIVSAALSRARQVATVVEYYRAKRDRS